MVQRTASISQKQKPGGRPSGWMLLPTACDEVIIRLLASSQCKSQVPDPHHRIENISRRLPKPEVFIEALCNLHARQCVEQDALVAYLAGILDDVLRKESPEAFT